MEEHAHELSAQTKKKRCRRSRLRGRGANTLSRSRRFATEARARQRLAQTISFTSDGFLSYCPSFSRFFFLSAVPGGEGMLAREEMPSCTLCADVAFRFSDEFASSSAISSLIPSLAINLPPFEIHAKQVPHLASIIRQFLIIHVIYRPNCFKYVLSFTLHHHDPALAPPSFPALLPASSPSPGN